MTKKLVRFIGIVAIVTLIGGLLGVSHPAPIIIGFVGPLSGPGAAEAGMEMMNAVEMAVEEINAAGGVLGKQLELITMDTSFDPAIGWMAMDYLADAGAVGVVGEFHSAVAQAEIEVANQRKLPFIISGAWADVLTAKQYPYVFRIAPAVSLFYTKVADWIKAIGFKNVVAIVENTDWGLDVNQIMGKILPRKGINYQSVIVERTVTDFTPQLRRFKAMVPHPDLLIDIFTGTGEYLIVKQACELGLKPPETMIFAVGTSALYPEFWETVGKCGVGVITKTAYHPDAFDTPAQREFSDKFKERTGKPSTLAAMEAYDSVYVLVKAIEKAGSTDPDKIVDALEKIEYEGVLGKIYFSTERKPAYMYHQWPDIKAILIKYTEEKQRPGEATVIYPLSHREYYQYSFGINFRFLPDSVYFGGNQQVTTVEAVSKVFLDRVLWRYEGHGAY